MNILTAIGVLIPMLLMATISCSDDNISIRKVLEEDRSAITTNAQVEHVDNLAWKSTVSAGLEVAAVRVIPLDDGATFLLRVRYVENNAGFVFDTLLVPVFLGSLDDAGSVITQRHDIYRLEVQDISRDDKSKVLLLRIHASSVPAGTKSVRLSFGGIAVIVPWKL